MDKLDKKEKAPPKNENRKTVNKEPRVVDIKLRDAKLNPFYYYSFSNRR